MHPRTDVLEIEELVKRADQRVAKCEMLLLQLDMLAYVDESGGAPTLVIGAGIPKEWLDLTMSVKELSTRLGKVDWEWRKGRMAVRLRGDQCAVKLGPAFPADAPLKVRD